MKFLRSFFILAISLITGLAIAGCGGGGNNSPAAARYFAYLVNGQSILVYSLNPATGSLQSTGKKFTVTDGMSFQAVKANPSQPYLYATCSGSKNSIKVFGISATTGELTYKSEIGTDEYYEQIEFSQDGNCLVAGVNLHFTGTISFAIGADGKLTKNDPPLEALNRDTYCIKFSEDGKALYYTTSSYYNGSKIIKYTYSNGQFSNKTELPLDFTPLQFAIYNNFIFLKGYNNTLYRLPSDLSSPPTLERQTNILGLLTYNNYLYGSSDKIYGYSIDPAGNLTEFDGAKAPYDNMTLSNMTLAAGNYLYAVDKYQTKLVGYRIESNGRLTSLDLKVSDPTTYFAVAKFQ